LTPAALPTTKRELGKLGVTQPNQLKQPPPTGLLADVRVALNTDDDGRQFNKVLGFKIVELPPAASALQPDADEFGEDEEDEDDEEEDTRDSQGFDWASGEHREPPR
jgi:hypothetical protein